MTKIRSLLLALLLAFVVAIGWQSLRADDRPAAPVATAPTPQSLPTVTVTLAGKSFVLEVADDDGEREIGLMYRRQMAADHGMIFVFPDADFRSFWMRNTLIPLDIVYLDERGRVLNVEAMKALDESSIRSDGRAMYAIELNAGVGKSLGLKRGDRVELPSLTGK